MISEKPKKNLRTPRHVRFPKDVEDDLHRIAQANDISWQDALRMAARKGIPILKKGLCEA